MKGFPKVLKTAQDVKNCKDMVDAGQLQAATFWKQSKRSKTRILLFARSANYQRIKRR